MASKGQAFLTEPPQRSIALFPAIKPRRRELFPSVSCRRCGGGGDANSKTPRRPPFRRKRKLDVETFNKLTSEIRQHELESWLRTTNRFPEWRWSVQEKRSLRSWFDRLDADGSGEIDAEELADPLLSSGIVGTMADVRDLLQSVDEDNNGTVAFKEFLLIMRPREKSQDCSINASKRLPVISQKRDNKKRHDSSWLDPASVVWGLNKGKENMKGRESPSQNVNPIARLQEIQKSGDLDLKSILAFKRRKLLLDATVGEAQRRDQAFDEISRWKSELRELHGLSKFQRLRDITLMHQTLDKSEREKQHFITAMERIIVKAMA